MTKKDALNAVVSLPDVSDMELEKALLDNDVTDGDYTKSDEKAIDMAAIDILTNRWNIASQTEGGLSISYSVDGLKAKLLALANKHGLTDLIAQFSGQPRIIDVTDKW